MNKAGKELNATLLAHIVNTIYQITAKLQPKNVYVLDLSKVASLASSKFYLILASYDNDGNMTEEIIPRFTEVFTKSFSVIIPNFAKSIAKMP